MPVIAVRHPLVRHKIGLLREHDISTKKFRELTNELGRLLAYEATADFVLESTTIDCWSGPVQIEQIAGRKVTVVPILRAGLGMLDGVLDMIPSAKVSVVGLSRNHETLQPEHYFERFVGHLDERTALIVDPMLATAGSMIATVDLLVSGVVPSLAMHRWMPALLYKPLYTVIDVFNLVVLLMVTWAVIRRVFVRPALIPMTLDAGLILGAIGSLMLSHFLYHGYEVAHARALGAAAPAGMPLSTVLGEWMSPLSAEVAHRGATIS